MEGDGRIVIILYGKTNLLDDWDAFITELVTATPPSYSTEPVKEGVGLSARKIIEDFSARCMFDIFGEVLHQDFVGNSDIVELTLACTEVCKQIQHLRQSFKGKHGQFFQNPPDNCFASTCP